jgi:hypothetical protein
MPIGSVNDARLRKPRAALGAKIRNHKFVAFRFLLRLSENNARNKEQQNELVHL